MAKSNKEDQKDTVENLDPVIAGDNVPTFTAGLAIDRPLKPIANSIYYEKDTGNRLQFVEGKWTVFDNIRN